jgi:hypothetical protein
LKGAADVLRLVALVALHLGVDPTEPVERVKAMLASDPNVEQFEVGLCEPAAPGATPPAAYVIVVTFADHAAFGRYATGEPHGTFARWIAPYQLDCTAVTYQVAE